MKDELESAVSKDNEIKSSDADANLHSNRYSNMSATSVVVAVESPREVSEEEEDALYVFRYILILVAALESFAHGSNDTANATAALGAIFVVNNDGLDSCETMETPVWIMAIAGFFVLVGVYALGYRVMRTIGNKISAINIHRAFCMELASTITIVIATLCKVPVSTTHCQVGAVVFVSFTALGKEHVKFGMVGRIISSWVLTLPIAAVIAIVFTAIF